MSKLEFGQEPQMLANIPAPQDGVLVHGLFMDGFRWDDDTAVVSNSRTGEMMSRLPMVHMEPKMDFLPPETDYIAPLYKTSARAGTLSTTGQFL